LDRTQPVNATALPVSLRLDIPATTGRAPSPRAAAPTLFATASRDTTTGEVILKVVNTASEAQTVEVALTGVTSVGASAVAEVLSGAPWAMNSVTDPHHVVPIRVPMTNAASRFVQTFPAYSVTVLVLPAR
jgi:alpha-N-arabinofuranosidase